MIIPVEIIEESDLNFQFQFAVSFSRYLVHISRTLTIKKKNYTFFSIFRIVPTNDIKITLRIALFTKVKVIKWTKNKQK